MTKQADERVLLTSKAMEGKGPMKETSDLNAPLQNSVTDTAMMSVTIADEEAGFEDDIYPAKKQRYPKADEVSNRRLGLDRRRSSFGQFVKKQAQSFKEHSTKEQVFVMAMGICLSFNSGYINGCCLSGLLSPDGRGRSQGVSAFTGTYTMSGLSLADGAISFFGFEISMVLSFIAGAFASGLINPKAVPHQVGPTYGPSFLLGSLLLVISSIFAALDPASNTLFFFAAAANGLQNGMSSMYTANLIRTSHLTGTSTDIGVILGQIVRGNTKNTWKLWVLLSLAVSFWFGSFISFYAVRRFFNLSLVFNACFFFLIGAVSIMYTVVTQNVSLWQAASGTWKWDAALDHLQITTKDGQVADKDYITDMFSKMDEDGSGSISIEELTAALEQVGLHLSRRDLKAMIRVADKDGDGEISLEEMQNLVAKRSSVRK